MLKFYYGLGTCSLASHIVLNEAGATFSVERVDIRAGKTETIRVNLKSIDSGASTYYLLPGDEVFVPERIF